MDRLARSRSLWAPGLEGYLLGMGGLSGCMQLTSRGSRHSASLALWSPELHPHGGQLGLEGLWSLHQGPWGTVMSFLWCRLFQSSTRKCQGGKNRQWHAQPPSPGHPEQWSSTRRLRRGCRSATAATRLCQMVIHCAVTHACVQTQALLCLERGPGGEHSTDGFLHGTLLNFLWRQICILR